MIVEFVNQTLYIFIVFLIRKKISVVEWLICLSFFINSLTTLTMYKNWLTIITINYILYIKISKYLIYSHSWVRAPTYHTEGEHVNHYITGVAWFSVISLGNQYFNILQIVAVSLHYMLLSAMSWMLVEAFYMYLALIKVFNTHFSHFLLKCCLFGWGMFFHNVENKKYLWR